MKKNPLLANPKLAKELDKLLKDYRFNGKALLGIPSTAEREALTAQIIDSVARINFVKRIAERPISPKRLDPKDKLFDPLRAAIQHMRDGSLDEAFWLVFLFVHCGKHAAKGYGLLRMVYGAFQDKFVWTWERFNQNPSFSAWLGQHIDAIKQERHSFSFGNHRKYESLDKLDVVLNSYAEWIGPNRSHEQFIAVAKAQVGDDPKALFGYLYKSMAAVHRFGRTAKFDYLTMVGKIGLVNIEPPSAYMVHATGPVGGARLLFTGALDNNSISKAKLDELSVDLGQALGVNMQVIEDALCNWQKRPAEYLQFRG